MFWKTRGSSSFFLQQVVLLIYSGLTRGTLHCRIPRFKEVGSYGKTLRLASCFAASMVLLAVVPSMEARLKGAVVSNLRNNPSFSS